MARTVTFKETNGLFASLIRQQHPQITRYNIRTSAFYPRPPVEIIAVGYSSHANAVIDIFAAYTKAVTHNAFQCAGRPPKLPPPLGGGSLGPPKSYLYLYLKVDGLVSNALSAHISPVFVHPALECIDGCRHHNVLRKPVPVCDYSVAE